MFWLGDENVSADRVQCTFVLLGGATGHSSCLVETHVVGAHLERIARLVVGDQDLEILKSVGCEKQKQELNNVNRSNIMELYEKYGNTAVYICNEPPL